MVTVQIKIPNLLDRILVLPLIIYRLLKYGYAFRRIYLGEEIWTIVEPRDYYSLKNYNWYISGNSKQFYAFRNTKIAPGKTKMLAMHRQIIDAPVNLVVDHINNNPLDNRRANLRLATRAQNAYNRKKISAETSSRYIGIYFEKRTGRWTAKIRTNGKRLWLGRFVSELDAARAYDKAALKYHKEFAKLNFPEEYSGACHP